MDSLFSKSLPDCSDADQNDKKRNDIVKQNMPTGTTTETNLGTFVEKTQAKAEQKRPLEEGCPKLENENPTEDQKISPSIDGEQNDEEIVMEHVDQSSLLLRYLLDENLLRIFGELKDEEDQMNLSMVCRRFRDISHDLFWKKSIIARIPRHPENSIQIEDEQITVTRRDFRKLGQVACSSPNLEYLNIHYAGSHDPELHKYIEDILAEIFRKCRRLQALVYNPMCVPHTLNVKVDNLMMHPVDAFKKFIDGCPITFKELNLEGDSNLEEKLIRKSRETLEKLTLHHAKLTVSLVETINSCDKLKMLRFVKTVNCDGDFGRNGICLNVPQIELACAFDRFSTVREDLFSLSNAEGYVLFTEKLENLTFIMETSMTTIIQALNLCPKLCVANIRLGYAHYADDYEALFKKLDSHSSIEKLKISVTYNHPAHFILEVVSYISDKFNVDFRKGLTNRIEYHITRRREEKCRVTQ